jgi:hypothetical protein
MPDLAAFCYGCPFCESGASSGIEWALHLEEHFLEGADRWFRAVLPRVVEDPPAEVPVPA